MSFEVFDIERDYDYLRGGNGIDFTKSSELFKFSGNVLPGDIQSSGNTMWLVFSSDDIINKKGFLLWARSIPPVGMFITYRT